LETDSINNGQLAEVEPAEAAATEHVTAPPGDQAPDGAGPTAGAAAPEQARLDELTATVREVADLSRRYHARAEQREGVIDLLRSEVEVLRRGERRELLRPILADLCRLRGDLLAQAASLPPDFDAAKAADLLASYAETVEQTLESNGVVAYTPEDGERFDPRLHRRVGSAGAGDPSLAGHVAAVRRDGYLDIAANAPIAPAQVTVFAASEAAGGQPTDVTKATEGEQ
jgi:molecular chaperone GrpE (heat shock protein)